MNIFNWHIIHDSELKRLRDQSLKLRRKLTDRQIEELLDGKAHIARNQNRQKKPDLMSMLTPENREFVSKFLDRELGEDRHKCA